MFGYIVGYVLAAAFILDNIMLVKNFAFKTGFAE